MYLLRNSISHEKKRSVLRAQLEVSFHPLTMCFGRTVVNKGVLPVMEPRIRTSWDRLCNSGHYIPLLPYLSKRAYSAFTYARYAWPLNSDAFRSTVHQFMDFEQTTPLARLRQACKSASMRNRTFWGFQRDHLRPIPPLWRTRLLNTSIDERN